MGELTLLEIIGGILAVAAAVNTIGSAVEKIVKAAKAANNPNEVQNDRLDELERWRKDVDQRLVNGNTHFDSIDASTRVTQRALLALLSHGIDGNNIKDMEAAKHEIETYLISK